MDIPSPMPTFHNCLRKGDISGGYDDTDASDDVISGAMKRQTHLKMSSLGDMTIRIHLMSSSLGATMPLMVSLRDVSVG